MNLNDAVKHCEEIIQSQSSYNCNPECLEQHGQLMSWLKELIDYKDYLSVILGNKKLELRELEVERRIFLATTQARMDLINGQIDSIERQLNKHD